MEWADARVWTTVLAAAISEDDALIRERLLHIHIVQRTFLHICLDQALPPIPVTSKFPNAAAVALWGRQSHEAITPWLNRTDAHSLATPLRLPFASFFEAQFGKSDAVITVAQTILQVTSHSSHHRGQVNARLRELGVPPPTVDFIIWLWLGKPIAEWPTQ